MRRFLLLAALCATLATGLALPAAAQIRDGDYAAAGTNPDGSVYTGLLTIRAAPNGSWLAIWQVGNARVNGVGVISAGTLAIGYTINGSPGVAAYEVQADGKLRGVWTVGGGMGTEVLTPQ